MDRLALPLRLLRVGTVLLVATMAFACSVLQNRTLAAWEHYDACMTLTTTFVGMALCGEDRLKAHCNLQRSDTQCGAMAAAVIAYANSLVNQVEGGRLSDGEAARRWSQFELLPAAEQLKLGQAASPPVPTPSQPAPASARPQRQQNRQMR